MSTPTSLINKAAVKRCLLERAMQKWPSGKFTRVSADVFDELESVVRNWCSSFVQSHPTVGKTLMTKARSRTNAPED